MSASRKRNELDLDEEDALSDGGYDSEQQESRGALVGRSAKRRRLSDRSDDAASGSEDDGDDRFVTALKSGPEALDSLDFNDDDGEQLAASTPRVPKKSKLDPVEPLTMKQLKASQKAAKKTGVVYLSRIPPFMKPQALKHYFSAYGQVNRVFLTPEDAPARAQRLRNGGNKKTMYLDGWVEFLSKKDAKMVADALNGNTVGGKKGGYYHDDIWNIKYLRGFKWNHLTEQIANENAERAARLRAEIARTRRENKDFVRDVERGKMMETRRAKKAKRQGDGQEGDDDAGGEPKLKFKQNAVRGTERAKTAASAPLQSDSTTRVLSKLF